MRAVISEPSPTPPVNVVRSELTIDSGHRSETDTAQAAFIGSHAHIERVVFLIHERDRLDTTLKNVNQRLSELDEELHVVQVEKSVLAANIDRRPADIN